MPQKATVTKGINKTIMANTLQKTKSSLLSPILTNYD